MANATLAEYKKHTDIQQEGETVTIIRVADHKMGLFRSAKLVILTDDLLKHHAYVTPTVLKLMPGSTKRSQGHHMRPRLLQVSIG